MLRFSWNYDTRQASTKGMRPVIWLRFNKNEDMRSSLCGKRSHQTYTANPIITLSRTSSLWSSATELFDVLYCHLQANGCLSDLYRPVFSVKPGNVPAAVVLACKNTKRWIENTCSSRLQVVLQAIHWKLMRQCISNLALPCFYCIDLMVGPNLVTMETNLPTSLLIHNSSFTDLPPIFKLSP